MKKIKKRILIIKLCILVVILGFLANSIGYLPVIRNMIAEKKLSKYSSTVKKSVHKVETKYDWYNTKYQSIKGNLSYRLQKNTIFDEKASNQINLVASEQYNKIKGEFSENLNFPNGIYIWTEVNANDYSKKIPKALYFGCL